jgi:hypothetical protein
MDTELLWSFEDTRKRLKKTKWGLRWLIRLHALPIVRIGKGRGKIYFDPEDVKAYIQKQKIPAQNGEEGNER